MGVMCAPPRGRASARARRLRGSTDYWINRIFCIPYMTCSLEWLTDNDTNHHAAQQRCPSTRGRKNVRRGGRATA